MTAPRLLLPSLILPVATVAACGEKAAPGSAADEAGAKAPAGTTGATEHPPQEAATGTDATGTDATDATDAADAAEPTKPAAVAGEDWLLWFERDGQYTTRWLQVSADGFEVVAEKKAPFLSDGIRIWRLARHDVELETMSCECMDDEDAPECVSGKTTREGLVAALLGTDTETPIVTPSSESVTGSDIVAVVRLTGGSGARLFLSVFEDGFYCGAHPEYFSVHRIVDLAATPPAKVDLVALVKALPDDVWQTGAKGVLAALRECEEEPAWTETGARDQISLDAVGVGLDAAGAVGVHWVFSTDTTYVCAHDYRAAGTADTGLIPGAAMIGLTGPLPAGLEKALAALGEAPTVGWSKLSLSGEPRDAALEQFRAAPEPAWPKPSNPG